jgi:hypothetical protein
MERWQVVVIVLLILSLLLAPERYKDIVAIAWLLFILVLLAYQWLTDKSMR